MKKKVLIVMFTIIAFGLGVLVEKLLLSNNDIDDSFNGLSQAKHENMLSMMLEQTAGAGNYSLETRSTWPTQEEGYVFNSTLSKCEKGSKLRWDDENNAVVMVGTTSDKCYVYFDVYEQSITLTDYVKAQYTGTQGDNSLYYHNGTITNKSGSKVVDANDNSYRYAGADPNNYVCFGSNTDICPDDNLYRIIGVFKDQVKLIKYDYATSRSLGTDGDYKTLCSDSDYCTGTNKGTNDKNQIGIYYWNWQQNMTVNDGKGSNTWSTSFLNKINLNTNFLTNVGSEWANKIATVIWKTGGNTQTNIQDAMASVAYENEIVNPVTTNTTDGKNEYEAKIGLMYISDYGFAASPSTWTTTLDSYNFSSITSVNWMYIGLEEWIMTRWSEYAYRNYAVASTGYIIGHPASEPYAVRPTFYLNSNVIKVGDNIGSKTDPIRIE